MFLETAKLELINGLGAMVCGILMSVYKPSFCIYPHIKSNSRQTSAGQRSACVIDIKEKKHEHARTYAWWKGERAFDRKITYQERMGTFRL